MRRWNNSNLFQRVQVDLEKSFLGIEAHLDLGLQFIIEFEISDQDSTSKQQIYFCKLIGNLS